MNNGTVQGFGSGVRLQDGASDNLVNNVRANNNNYGIRLYGVSNNHITGNSCTGNFEGIAVDVDSNSVDSTNNLIDENVTNGSVASGIGIAGSNNTIADNSSSGNFSGIGLAAAATGNSIRGNQVNSNTFYGMDVFGSTNSIANNVANSNGAGTSNAYGTGILVRVDATGNTIEGNTALGNFGSDMTELNPGSAPACANTWLNNIFKTTSPRGHVHLLSIAHNWDDDNRTRHQRRGLRRCRQRCHRNAGTPNKLAQGAND